MEKKSKKGLIIGIVIAAIFLLAVIVLLFSCSSEEEAETEENITAQEDEETFESGPEEEDAETETEAAVSRSVDPSGSTWTIMIYLCGSDLESEHGAATENLKEILDTDFSDKVNVLVETGGSTKWSMDDPQIDTDSLGYYRLYDDGFKLEKTESLKSMGDPGTLKEFITWGAESAPADKYMMVLWDHGGGSTGGVCFDENFEGDSLSLAELKQAFSEADVPFEVIGFDACLMASLETAEAIQGYGHYMIASEENEPGGGWDYTDYMKYLSSDTTMDGKKLGKCIADGFLKKCALTEEDDMATLSVTDLTRIPALSATYRKLSSEMVLSSQDPVSLRTITRGASKAVCYGPNTDMNGYTNMVDLGDLVNQTGSVLNQNSASVTKALHDAVCYETHGQNRKNSNGISVFYPLGVQDWQFEIYKECTDNAAFVGFTNIVLGNFDTVEWQKTWEEAWKEAYGSQEVKEGKYDSLFNNGQSIAADYGEPLSEDYYESVGSVDPVKKEDYDLKFTESKDDDGYHHLKISSGLDMVEGVNFLLYYEDDETGNYVYLGSDNELVADYDTGEFCEDFHGTWITIGDEFVYAELTEENEDYNLYTIPILLNGEEKYIKAVYEFDKEAFRILGAYDGLEGDDGQADHSGRDVKQLKNGDKIEFLFYVFDPKEEEKEDEDEDLVSISSIVWNDDMKMEDSEIAQGGIIYMFMIKSVFGDEDFGEPIYMTIKDGMISEGEAE